MKRLSTIILATRPWSFSMTAISVTLGSILILPEGGFRWELYLPVLLGMILVHAATNLANDYFDVKHGVDSQDSPTSRYREHPLIEETLKPQHILYLSLVFYFTAGLIGLYLALVRGWIIIVLACLGGFASFFYTAGPIKYKHYALGELSVFFMWGPLMMAASYFIQVGNWAFIFPVVLLSIPQGLWVALVLLGNNLKDIEYDRKIGLKTLGTIFGRRGTIGFYILMVSLIYLVTGLEILIGVIPVWGIVSFASLPLIVRLILTFRREKEIPSDADPRTAQAGMIYGLLLIASFLISILVQ